MSGTPFLDERVRQQAAAAPKAPAIGTPAGWMTYAELSAAIDQLAASLQAHGVGRGTLVLNGLKNGYAAVVAGLAVQRAGGCVVEVTAGAGTSTLEEIIVTTRARHMFVDGRELRTIEPFGSRWQALWVVDGAAKAIDAAAALAEAIVAVDHHGRCAGADTLLEVERSADDLALIQFTSGSTGRPRGVMISHGNLAANTAGIIDSLQLTAADRVMSILPLSYCYGRSLLQTHLSVGGSVFFDHRFMYPGLVVDALVRERCTGFAGVPATFEMLRRAVGDRRLAGPDLRYVTQAGGAMGAELRAWARQAFAPARLHIMYGQTEATARLACLPPEFLDSKAGSFGRPITGVELRIVDDTGRELPVGEVGNLIARGASITRGYFEAPEETREILKDGWLWTGDLARRDEDGFFFFTGRTRAMLKINGHRFSPHEVEERLVQHEDVREACVVGGNQGVTGEILWAFVVRGGKADAAELQRFCAAALPSFAVPRRVEFVDALPRSTSGKVQRAELESRARGQAAPSPVPRVQVQPSPSRTEVPSRTRRRRAPLRCSPRRTHHSRA